MSDLKPCPFCGGDAHLVRDTDGSVYVDVDHAKGCYLSNDDTRRWFYGEDGKSAEEVAAAAWNRRHTGARKVRAWLVSDCGGEWSDAYEVPVIAFMDKGKAEECASIREARSNASDPEDPEWCIVSEIELLIDR